MKTEDYGQDLEIGDIVFIKCYVASNPNTHGDVELQYVGRNRYNGYGKSSTNSIFLKRYRSRFMKWIVKKLCSDRYERNSYESLRNQMRVNQDGIPENINICKENHPPKLRIF